VSDTETGDTGQSRRQFMRITAGAVGMGVGSQVLPNGPVQESEAIAPAVAAGGIGASAATGWVLRELEIVGSDDPPEGATPEALHNQIYEAAMARRSNNKSTFVDNDTILDQAQQAAYSAGKRAAFEAIDEGKSESETLSDAQEAVSDHYTTVHKNLLRSWNETIAELDAHIEAVEEHDDLSKKGGVWDVNAHSFLTLTTNLEETTHELFNGEEIKLHELGVQWNSEFGRNDPSTSYSDGVSGNNRVLLIEPYDGGTEVEYANGSEWSDISDDIENQHDEVIDEIEKWVENTYGEVQSGEIDTSELLTATDLADMTAEEEGFNQATADLQALNIETQTETNVEIKFIESETTLIGNLAYTGEDSLSSGEIDPDDKGAIYLTYDLQQGNGLWDNYDESLNGGVLTFTEKPPEGYLFEGVTSYDETVFFDTSEVTNEDGNYQIDLSDELEEPIAEIELYLTSASTQYETVQLDEPFEIVEITDSDGESIDQIEFDNPEPHTDDNYISQEEWDEQRERHEELIEQYEDAQGGGSTGFLDGEEIPAEGVLLIVLAIFAALFGR